MHFKNILKPVRYQSNQQVIFKQQNKDVLELPSQELVRGNKFSSSQLPEHQ